MFRSIIKNNLSIILILFNNNIFSQSSVSSMLTIDHENNITIRDNRIDAKYISTPFKDAFFLINRNDINENDLIKIDSIIATSVQLASLKIIFQYNKNGKISEWLILLPYNNSWVNSDKDVLDYDTNNNLITDTWLGWNNVEWDTLTRINYSYDSQGLVTGNVFQNYVASSWINSSSENYEYDSHGNLKTSQGKVWMDNRWENNLLINFYYSNKDLRDSALLQVWNFDKWENHSKTIFYYNELNANLDSLLAKTWTGNRWNDYMKRKIAYYEGYNQTEELDQIWDVNDWLNQTRRFYTYQESNFITNAFCEIWENNDWVAGDGDIYFENPDGFKVALITNNIDAYYSKITDIKDETKFSSINYNLMQNYPNPFNPTTNIRYQISQKGLVSLKVYDILGKEVTNLVNEEKAPGMYKTEFNASFLPSGIYFYRLQINSYVKTMKMLLLK